MSQDLRQAVRQHHGQRQARRRFIAGVAVHDALVACSGLCAAIDCSGDIGALLMGDDLHLIVAAAISGFPHSAADDGRDVREPRCGDLTCRDDLARGRHDLTGNAGSGVLRKTGIHHRVRDGVAELVGMSLGD